MRYQQELPTKENPLRIGIKRIKISGIEYPFIAVSDHWRPALLHENRSVWITHYRAIQGPRKGIFYVFCAVGKVPFNRLPWTVDNKNCGEYRTLIEAINKALLIVHEMGVSSAAATLGRKGGQVTSPRKVETARENGRRGGRPKRKTVEDFVNTINPDEL